MQINRLIPEGPELRKIGLNKEILSRGLPRNNKFLIFFESRNNNSNPDRVWLKTSTQGMQVWSLKLTKVEAALLWLLKLDFPSTNIKNSDKN